MPVMACNFFTAYSNIILSYHPIEAVIALFKSQAPFLVDASDKPAGSST